MTTMEMPLDLDGPFAVETAGLAKRYGATRALENVRLLVPEQAVYVLVGPNGAGKSTLLRSLLNLVRPGAGSIRVHGVDTRTRAAEARALVGYVPEGHDLGHSWLRVHRLFEHRARYYSSWDAEYAKRLMRALAIRPEAKCGALSKGERRRVQLALALAQRPALLLLDEPGDGLDHVARERVLELLTEHLVDHPTTVLVSTHRIYEIERLVDHVGVLDGGTLLGQMTRDALDRRMRRYRADVPDGWSWPDDAAPRVLRRGGLGRSIDWTVWGAESEVVALLRASGATVREVASVTLDDAATALLLGRAS